MRNYKQIDTTTEERVKKRDIFGAIVALAGVTLFIWSVI